jgi:hypothetical protein
MVVMKVMKKEIRKVANLVHHLVLQSVILKAVHLVMKTVIYLEMKMVVN